MVANFACHLDMVINLNASYVRFVLGDTGAKTFKLGRVLKWYIVKTDHSVRVFIFKMHMV